MTLVLISRVNIMYVNSAACGTTGSRLTCFLRRGAWLVVMRLRGKHSLIANLPGVRDAALLDLLLLAGRHLLRVLLGKLVWEESHKYAYSWREGLG